MGMIIFVLIVFVVIFLILSSISNEKKENISNTTGYQPSRANSSANYEVNETVSRPRFVDVSYVKQDEFIDLDAYEEYVVMDTETSGLEPTNGNEILQLGVIKYNRKTGEKIDTFCVLIKPSFHCVFDKQAMRINGLKMEDLQNGVEKETAFRQFMEFAGDRILIGYNISFDMKFLLHGMVKAGITPPQYRVMDVLAFVKSLNLPTENNRLKTISKHLGFKGKNYHDALMDGEATNFILRKIGFDEEGNTIDVSKTNKNHYDKGIAIDPYVAEQFIEVDIFSRQTGELIATKLIDECKEVAKTLNRSKVLMAVESHEWIGAYGVRLHKDNLEKIERDYTYGKRAIDVYLKTGEYYKRYDDIPELITDLGFMMSNESAIKTLLAQNPPRFNYDGYVFIYASSPNPPETIEPVLEEKTRKKPIYVYDLEGNLIDECKTLAECSGKHNLQQDAIRRCLLGGKPQYNGFIFRNEKVEITAEELAKAKEAYAYREISNSQNKDKTKD